MRCHESARIGPLADRELDGGDRAAVERHVVGCVPCRDALAGVFALRRGMQAEALRFALPPSLSTRVLEAVAVADRRPSSGSGDERPTPPRGVARPVRRWTWLASGAFGGAAMTAGAFVLVMALDAGRTRNALVDEVVAAHGRAATTGHLVDVGSSDQHTVKPWLSQRLDYSPPVPDLAAAGFPLIGGRLDRLEQSPVATLVYGYGHHTIDVFVRPIGDHGSGGIERPTVIRGFNLVESRGRGMDWIGISDVNATQLAQLMRLLATTGAPAGPEPGGLVP